MKMLRYLLLCVVFFQLEASAQYDEIGIMAGASRYKGELSQQMFSTDFLHPAVGFFYRHNWNRHWSWKLELNLGGISGDDAYSKNEFELNRNLSFHSSIFEISPQIEFNFFTYETGNPQYPFTPYIFTGLSVFRFNPKAELGDDDIELQPLGTEGQGFNGEKKYRRVQLAIPVGGGIKINAGRLGFGIEVGARRAYTDYLDDVSTVYPDMAQLAATSGPVAVMLSDRSFPVADTSIAIPSIYRKQRGNSSDKDWYLFAGVTIFWRLSSPLRDICRPFKSRNYH